MKRYFWDSTIFMGLIFLLFIVTTTVVDPYQVFNIINIKGFNLVKPFTSNKEQVFKPIALYKQQPEIIILGSSRVQMGLDPQKVMNVTGSSAYNFGIDGPTIYEILYFQKFAINNTQAKTMVLGLDLLMFNGSRDKNNTRFYLPRMKSNLDDSNKDLLSIPEISSITLTVQSVTDSLKTVFMQDHTPYYDEYGFVRKQNFNIDKKMFYEMNFESSAAVYSKLHKNFNYYFKDESFTYQYFREIVHDAYTNEINLILFFSPIHQFFHDVMDRENLLTLHHTWKNKLKLIVAEEALRAGRSKLTMFDFSDDERNQEQFPVNGEMYYWNDAYHYSLNYGNEIIESIFAGLPASREISQGL